MKIVENEKYYYQPRTCHQCIMGTANPLRMSAAQQTIDIQIDSSNVEPIFCCALCGYALSLAITRSIVDRRRTCLMSEYIVRGAWVSDAE